VSRLCQVQECKDQDGTLRLFRITVSPGLWHCVHSSGNRWSMGFHLSDDAARRLQEMMRPVVPSPPPQPTPRPPRPASSTPRSVSLLFGSSNGAGGKGVSRRKAPPTGAGEEEKAGDSFEVPELGQGAWVRSGELSQGGDSGAEEADYDDLQLPFHEVRLSESVGDGGSFLKG
jgi:hypothetical protein